MFNYALSPAKIRNHKLENGNCKQQKSIKTADETHCRNIYEFCSGKCSFDSNINRPVFSLAEFNSAPNEIVATVRFPYNL
jgi:hypothetical protein